VPPSVEIFVEWMNHVFEHEGWHVSLLDSVKGLSARQAAWTPSPERHSIWQIVEHLALWKEEGARHLRGDPPRPPGWAKDHDWRDTGEVSDPRWQGTITRLTDAQKTVRAALEALAEADLNRPLPGFAGSAAETIRGIVLHDSYHCGQICHLRALQGVPAKIW
jgi:DinB superfamily